MNKILVLLLVLASCVSPTPTPTVSPIVTPPPSPLILGIPTVTPTIVPEHPSNIPNGSFEDPYNCSSARCTAGEWTSWYIVIAPDGHTAPPCDPDMSGCHVTCPLNCLNEFGSCKPDHSCFWQQPEFTSASQIVYAYRVHSGRKSQSYFGYGRMFDAGVFQKVRVQPGRWYEFSVWMQGWMCYRDDRCANGLVSDEPTTFHLQVGIDPTGGVDPLASSVLWGTEGDSFDEWKQFKVSAQAQSNKITVFTRARPDWGDDHLRINNNVYIDDADLVPIDPPPTPIWSAWTYLPLVVKK